MNNNSTGSVGLKGRLAYGSGDLASALIYQGLGFFILIYWTNEALISPAAAGMILLVSRIFDGFTDIFFGRMVDKVKSKHGKARPWLLWLSIPFGISAVMTFWSPGSDSNTMNIIYAFISYNITMTIYTAINIPYGVLNAKMTSDPVERGVLGVFRGLGVVIGITIVMGLTPVLVQSFGYSVAFMILGALGATLILFTFYGTKEVYGNDMESEEISFKDSIKVLSKNLPWFLMLFGGIVLFTGGTAKTAAMAYYATYNLGNPALMAMLGVIGIPAMVLGMFAAPAMFKRFGKVKASIYSQLIMGAISVVYFVLSLEGLSPMELYSFIFISSVPFGIAMAAFFPLFSDAIEYGEYVTGQRVEGLTYSAASMGTKIGSGIGGAIMAWSLGISGFNAALEVQGDATHFIIEFMFLWAPIIAGVIYAIILMFNRSDKDREKVMATIESARKKQ